MITFIGTGLLGSNFTKALLARGEKVRVWNRTFTRAKELEAVGAEAFENVADAVAGVQRIHITLSDDASVDEVLAKVLPALTPGAMVIDHTTTTEKGAVQRTKDVATAGFTYIHVPVFMGPSNALEGTGYMLVSGDQAVIARVSPWLEKMTGKLMNFGDKPGKAAGLKLMGNLFLLTMLGGLSDMLTLAKSLDIPASDLTALLQAWNPGAGMPARLNKVLSGDFDQPSWELQMARKDARLMIEEAAQAGEQLLLVPPIAKTMDNWIEKGNGGKDWTIFATGKP
jgi:3-hydroxyisobutyrate dehydrogenase